MKNTLVGLTNNKTVNTKFDWSKDATVINVTSQRTKAANALVEYIKENNVEGEDVTLIGVSHGGNVVIQAAGILGEEGIKVNIITLNTPAENDSDDVENPNSNTGINDMIQITTKGDWVAGGLSTEDRTYDEKPSTYKRQELEISNSAKWYQPMKIHGTENVDTEQIKNSDLKKLKQVDLKKQL